MDDRRDRTGTRLGPYHLDKRYEDLDDAGGELYAAHHVETGRPALVLVPGPDDTWAPRSDWTARITSQVSPPFLATQLDRPPPSEASALTDLELAFIRIAGGVTGVQDREDANADFTRAPVLPPGGGPGTRRPLGRSAGMGLAAGLLLLGSGVLGALVIGPRLMRAPVRVEATPCSPYAESSVWMDQKETSSIGYPMPETAFAEQMKPPCEEGHVAIRGGCWGEMKNKAPCPNRTAEYEGKCYVPVRAAKPVPSSAKP